MESFNYQQFQKDMGSDYIPPIDFPEGTPRSGSYSGRPIKAYHQMRYELSEDITEWISRKAHEAGMTDSRYLSKILQDMMLKESRDVSRKRHYNDRKKKGGLVVVVSPKVRPKHKPDTRSGQGPSDEINKNI